MKKNIKKSIQTLSDLGCWIVNWVSILLVVGIFILLSLMLGGLIEKYFWIVFVADIIFCGLLWYLLSFYGHYDDEAFYNKRFLLLVVVIMILFMFIAMATLGLSSITDHNVMINMLILPGLVFITIVLSLYYNSRRDKKNSLIEDSDTKNK